VRRSNVRFTADRLSPARPHAWMIHPLSPSRQAYKFCPLLTVGHLPLLVAFGAQVRPIPRKRTFAFCDSLVLLGQTRPSASGMSATTRGRGSWPSTIRRHYRKRPARLSSRSRNAWAAKAKGLYASAYKTCLNGRLSRLHRGQKSRTTSFATRSDIPYSKPQSQPNVM
jgi:hypothetical protein